MSQSPLQPTIGELVASLTQQMSALVRGEIDLFKAQLAEKGQKFGIAAGLLAGAAFLGFFGFATIIACIVLAIAEVLAPWLAALIVALALFLIAGVLALVAKKQIDAAGEINPNPVEGIKQDISIVKEGFRNEHAERIAD
ncbi:phage holin family protein [Salana multivorans]